jgi:cold shock CspA family protein
MAEQTHSGTIISINTEKGFGFIRRDDGGRDVFFHVTDLDPSLNFYESLIEIRVVFDIVEAERGPKAVNIRRAS